MKKIFYSILTITIGLILISCNNKTDQIVFSKVYTASRLANNVIELYNNSDKDIDLTNYKLAFHSDSSSEITSEIELEGSISAHSYYVVGGPNFDDEEFPNVKDKFDLVHNKVLPFTGNDAIAVMKDKKVIDIVGYNNDITLDFGKNVTLIRLGEKESYEPTSTFDQFNFIKYITHAYKYLKNDDHKIKTLEDLYAGPRLHNFYKETPYVNPEDEQMGTGGAPIATVVGVSDGDTATFNFEGRPFNNSHRYYYIDTPEVKGPNTNDEPWGAIASMYNKEFILKDPETKEIRVQSVPNSGLGDTYNRNIGLVWINDNLSQFLTVQEGLSKVSPAFDNVDMLLHYEDVPYLTFLVFAQQRAIENGWGMHGYPDNPDGERALDWNYAANIRSPKANYEHWIPHIEINWNR